LQNIAALQGYRLKRKYRAYLDVYAHLRDPLIGAWGWRRILWMSTPYSSEMDAGINRQLPVESRRTDKK